MKMFQVTGSRKTPVFVKAKSEAKLKKRLGDVAFVVTIKEMKK